MSLAAAKEEPSVEPPQADCIREATLCRRQEGAALCRRQEGAALCRRQEGAALSSMLKIQQPWSVEPVRLQSSPEGH